MRLFFVALLTRFSAVLLPVTERRTYVLYYPLERTKRRVPMSGNSLAAPFALYTGCITNCIFGGFEAEEILPKWLFCEVCGPQVLFL